jgi:hypothetical protein
MDDHDYFGASSDKLQVNFWQKAALWFMAFMLYALLAISPQKKEEAKKEEAKSFGDMTVLISWPDKLDIDIDLWMLCASDERPVGYSNRAGIICNLQRDDLGKPNDSTDLNFEMVSTRGLPPGEYIVNIHYYKNHEPGDQAPEVPVKVVISTRATGAEKETGGMREIITRPRAVLRVEGEEITVARFVIKEDGELDQESVNDFYQELRTWQPPTQ